MKLTVEDVLKDQATTQKPRNKWGTKKRSEESPKDVPEIEQDFDSSETAEMESEPQETNREKRKRRKMERKERKKQIKQGDDSESPMDEAYSEEEPLEVDDYPEDPEYPDVSNEPEKESFSIFTLIKIAVASILILGIVVFGMHVIVSKLNFESKTYEPVKAINDTYIEALNASVEDFEEVNAARLSETAEEETEEPSEDTNDQDEGTESEIKVENPDATVTPEEQIETLKAEVDRLTQELETARTTAATTEQELSNTKSLLDASTARETRLQEELNAARAQITATK